MNDKIEKSLQYQEDKKLLLEAVRAVTFLNSSTDLINNAIIEKVVETSLPTLSTLIELNEGLTMDAAAAQATMMIKKAVDEESNNARLYVKLLGKMVYEIESKKSNK